jgi:hypothetical protein
MEPTLLIVVEPGVVVARPTPSGLVTSVTLAGQSPLCIAVDPHRFGRVYCGTVAGLWRSDDVGQSWIPAGRGITNARVTAVSIAATDGAQGTVYAGTAPSGVFRSSDGAGTWHECRGLTALPSASSWSFPPKPHTHHVRWIGIDTIDERQLFVCIEAGALIRSHDRGKTWHDRTPDGPIDSHTLATHRLAPGRVYAAAGDGYFESMDRGDTWHRPDAGLRHRYVWDVAVDIADPETILIAAASSARQAHRIESAESLIYRKSKGRDWAPAVTGLPPAQGTTISALASHTRKPGVFYACNNHGAFRSDDSGASWKRLDLTWPEAYRQLRVRALHVMADDAG